MVYCGKPSKGCAPCRAKRTKCDLKLPVCSQCIRTGRVCTGYRHFESTEFRDQSQVVSERVHCPTLPTKKPPRRPRSQQPLGLPPPQTTIDFGTEARISRIPQNTIPRSFCHFPVDGAVNFFFNDYLLEDSLNPKNVYDCLPRLYRAASPDSALSSIVIALGMACTANAMQVPEIMMRANMKYAQSLKAINSALRDPIDAKADETLLVVVLLGLYEEHNVTTKSIEPWTNHVKGALALLDYRGEEQLGNPIGLQLIRSLRTQVVVNCLVRRVDVPQTILKWSRLAREHENSHEVSESELVDIVAKFCGLQAAIDCHDYDMDPSSFASSALSIDAELEQWYIRWETSTLYTTIIAREDTPDVFEDYWHLYPNIMVAIIWNHYRCIRILINQIIITQLAAMTINSSADLMFEHSPIYNDQIDLSRRTIVELGHKVCASVPYYLNHYPGAPGESWNSSVDYASYNARAKLVLWPLYVVGQMEYVSDVMQTWVIERLEELSREMRTQKLKAKRLASLVRNRQRALGQAWRQLGMDE